MAIGVGSIGINSIGYAYLGDLYLTTLDSPYSGSPYCNVEAKDLTTTTLDYAYLGRPFVGLYYSVPGTNVTVALTGLYVTSLFGSLMPVNTHAMPQVISLRETIKFVLASGERSDLILTSSQLKLKKASGTTDNIAQV